jgi:hypothetical protein
VSRTFELRLLKSTWGIAIDLRAQAQFLLQAPSGLIMAGERTWLDVSKFTLPDQDIMQLAAGLALASPTIQLQHASGHVVVEVLHVDYTPTDYQSEGMAAAMLGWAAEEFDLDLPQVEVDFDKEANQYTFRW